MKKLAVFMTSVLVFAMMATAAFAADQIVFRFAGQQPVEHQCTKMMQDFAKEIADKTNGHVKIEVYPASQLGDYTLVMKSSSAAPSTCR